MIKVTCPDKRVVELADKQELKAFVKGYQQKHGRPGAFVYAKLDGEASAKEGWAIDLIEAGKH